MLVKDEEKSEGERKDDSDSKSRLKFYKGDCLIMGASGGHQPASPWNPQG